MVILTRTSNLIIVIVVIQTATFLQWHTAPSLENKSWFAEAATDTGPRAIGGGFHTGWDTSWTTVYIFCTRRAWFCTGKIRKKGQKKERTKGRKRKKGRFIRSLCGHLILGGLDVQR